MEKMFVKLDAQGVENLKKNYSHIYDEYKEYKECYDDLDGVFIYDGVFFIFKHKSVHSTIIGREVIREESLSLVEKELFEYVKECC
tara:strand:- start:9505 stop:9762 length:258 start_codon:yes stop_codon:yes gene_type:complete